MRGGERLLGAPGATACSRRTGNRVSTMSVDTERVEILVRTSEELLQETKELLARLQTKSDALLRQAGEISARIHSLAPDPDADAAP